MTRNLGELYSIYTTIYAVLDTVPYLDTFTKERFKFKT